LELYQWQRPSGSIGRSSENDKQPSCCDWFVATTDKAIFSKTKPTQVLLRTIPEMASIPFVEDRNAIAVPQNTIYPKVAIVPPQSQLVADTKAVLNIPIPTSITRSCPLLRRSFFRYLTRSPTSHSEPTGKEGISTCCLEQEIASSGTIVHAMFKPMGRPQTRYCSELLVRITCTLTILLLNFLRSTNIIN